MNRDVWFPFRVARDNQDYRIVCVPPAGKGCSVFRTWQAGAPDKVEVFGLQLPGRETRLREPPLDRIEAMTDNIVKALQHYADLPLVLFGHCFGAIVAFEVARRLPSSFIKLLCVSSCKPPSLLSKTNWFSGRYTDMEIISQAYGEAIAGLPTELLEELCPGLMADLVALDKYECNGSLKLECPIHVFRWEGDHTVSPLELEAWGEHSMVGFSQTHLNSYRDELALQGKAIIDAVVSRCEPL